MKMIYGKCKLIGGFARSVLLAGAMALFAGGCSKPVDDISLLATEDFPDIKVEGFAPYFVKDRRGVAVLNVDADVTGYEFAAADSTFPGETGIYDVTIYTLGDGDGVCKYAIQIGDKVPLAYYLQEQAVEAVMKHTWEDVFIQSGDRIRVMSNGSDSEKHEGGKGPAGYHMAHGRWIKLGFNRAD